MWPEGRNKKMRDFVLITLSSVPLNVGRSSISYAGAAFLFSVIKFTVVLSSLL